MEAMFIAFLVGFLAGLWAGHTGGWNSHVEYRRQQDYARADKLADEEKK